VPRRAAKKPPATLDLSSHLLPLAALSEPLDPGSLFPREQPVELEVGSGKGLFLATAVSAYPLRNFLGSEVSRSYARLTASRLAAATADNGRVIHGDAGQLVSRLLVDHSLSAVHVYFPDPWWKARHRKRRVLSEEFLQHVGRILQSGGRLHVWTDVEEYFREAMLAAASTGLFTPPLEDEPMTVPEGPVGDRTHFDRRTRLAGQPVWRGLLFRSDAVASRRRLELPRPASDLRLPGDAE
jgi:tRNA (guanine-N7-)-methyltransferase